MGGSSAGRRGTRAAGLLSCRPVYGVGERLSRAHGGPVAPKTNRLRAAIYRRIPKAAQEWTSLKKIIVPWQGGLLRTRTAKSNSFTSIMHPGR
jgi:hypothetical protein